MTEISTRNKAEKPLKLPIRFAAEVAYKSIKVRLSRSLVTVSSVVLAVAFLLSILGDQINAGAVYKEFTTDYQPIIDSQMLRNALTAQRDDKLLLQQFADPSREQHTREWANIPSELPASDVAELLVLAKWVDELKVTDRYKLIGLQNPVQYALTLDEQAVTELFNQLSQFTGTDPIPLQQSELSRLLGQLPLINKTLQILRDAEQERYALIESHEASEEVLTGSGLLDVLAQPEQAAAIGVDLSLILSGNVTPQRQQQLIDQLRREGDRRSVNEQIASFNLQSSSDLRAVRELLNKQRSGLVLLNNLLDETYGKLLVATINKPLPAQAERQAMSEILTWFSELDRAERRSLGSVSLAEMILQGPETLRPAADLGAPDSALNTVLTGQAYWAELLSTLSDAERERINTVRQHGAKNILSSIGTSSVEELAQKGLPINQIIRDQQETRRIALAALLDRRERPVTPELVMTGAVPSAERFIVESVGTEAFTRAQETFFERRRLDGLQATFLAMDYNPEAGSKRTFWLLVLSLLVCVVGIVNSMMMAVTERFREIATMKCLGAMDNFILKAFLIESGSVGLVGSMLGAVLGLIVVIIQSGLRFGESLWPAFPLAALLLAMAVSLLCGLFLTVFGALLPAYKAARMHPIEAMRLEA